MSPVVAWLCHEQCSDSGCVFEAAGGWVGKCKFSIVFTFKNSISMAAKAINKCNYA